MTSHERAAATLGRYTVGPMVARGGMGEVYLATQRAIGGFQKPIALKLLLPHLADDPAAVARFLEEARVAAMMSHPNIVQVFDAGVEGSRYFLAMELVHGVSLSRLISAIKAEGRFVSARLICYIAKCLCQAMHHAHELSAPGQRLELVHRDISPQNLLVSYEGQVKLSDFGIAKVRDSLRRTRSDVLQGKLEYLAPELLSKRPVDRRADLFAAGVTLYYLATLVSPFREDSEAATLFAIVSRPLVPLAELRPDLPAELGQAIERATQKDPALRPSTALELQAMLPALSLDGAEAELGELVKRLCGSELTALEHKTKQTARQTKGLRSTRWPAGLAAVALLLVACLWVAFGLGSGAQASAPPPATQPATSALADEPSASPATAAVVAPPLEERAPEAPPLEAPLPVKASRKPAARAKPSGPTEPAYLRVDAVPWAFVYVGGKRIGETPIARFPVQPGAHRITLKNPDTKRSVTRELHLRSGELEQLRVDLR